MKSIAESYEITRPPSLHLQPTETGFTVSRPDTGIWGFGRSPLDALIDYKQAVKDHRDIGEDDRG